MTQMYVLLYGAEKLVDHFLPFPPLVASALAAGAFLASGLALLAWFADGLGCPLSGAD